jgi:hypothetical protein
MDWRVAIHQAEALLNKSNRIICLIANQRSRWAPELRTGAVDITTAKALAPLFSVEYGISENAPQLAEWLVVNAVALSTPPAGNSRR